MKNRHLFLIPSFKFYSKANRREILYKYLINNSTKWRYERLQFYKLYFIAKIIRIALFLLGAYYKSNNKKLHTINQSLGNNIEHTKTNQSMFQITYTIYKLCPSSPSTRTCNTRRLVDAICLTPVSRGRAILKKFRVENGEVSPEFHRYESSIVTSLRAEVLFMYARINSKRLLFQY